MTLPLSYSRLRIHRTPRRNDSVFVPRSLAFVRFALNVSVADLPATISRPPPSVLNPTKPPRSRCLTNTTITVVARGGFEPPKPLGRQIYSLLRLTAPQPRRIPHTPPQSFNSRHTPIPAHLPGRSRTADERGINCYLEQLVYCLDGSDFTLTLRLYIGAGEGIRTPDPLITNQLLYRTELRQPDKLLILAHVTVVPEG